jgi:hypothetical protein
MAKNAQAANDACAAAPAPDLRGYRPGQSLMAQARTLATLEADALDRLDAAAVPAVLARDLGRALDIAPRHFFRDILGTNRSAAEKKSFTDALLPAAPGLRALRLLWLLGRVEAMAGNGAGAVGRFDAARWLGPWLEAPQPGPQGHRPVELLGSAGSLEELAVQAEEGLRQESGAR